LYRLAEIKPLGQQTNLYSSYNSLKHADRAQQTILQVLRNLSEAAIILIPSAQAFILSGREHNSQQTAVKSESYNRCNQSIQFKLNFKCGQHYSSIGADMGGQHQQWGCVGDAISRNTRSFIIRLNT